MLTKLLSSISLALLLSYVAQAQYTELEAESKGFTNLQQAGKLVTVKLVPTETEFKLFLIGKESAEVDFNEYDIEASYGLGGKKRKIVITTADDHLVLKKDKKPLETLDLKVKSGTNVEEFKFDLR